MKTKKTVADNIRENYPELYDFVPNEVKDAVKALKEFNEWRRDNTGEIKQPNPKEIGEAIDTITQYIDQLPNDKRFTFTF